MRSKNAETENHNNEEEISKIRIFKKQNWINNNENSTYIEWFQPIKYKK